MRAGCSTAPDCGGFAICFALSSWIFAGAALVGTGSTLREQPPFDFAPLYLGAHALARGLDPGSKQVHALLWLEVGSGPAPGAFFNPYPGVAALLAQPLALAVPWAEAAAVLRVVGLACIPASGAALFFLPGPSLTARVASAGLGVCAAANQDALVHAIQIGQVSPLVVALTLTAAVTLVTRRDFVAGVTLCVGMGMTHMSV